MSGLDSLLHLNIFFYVESFEISLFILVLEMCAIIHFGSAFYDKERGMSL